MIVCTACRAAVDAADKFCPSCGKTVEPPAPAAAAPPPGMAPAHVSTIVWMGAASVLLFIEALLAGLRDRGDGVGIYTITVLPAALAILGAARPVRWWIAALAGFGLGTAGFLGFAVANDFRDTDGLLLLLAAPPGLAAIAAGAAAISRRLRGRK